MVRGSEETRAERHEAGETGDARSTEARSAEVNSAETWARVKRRLRAELGEEVFTSWFGRLELGAVAEGEPCAAGRHQLERAASDEPR